MDSPVRKALKRNDYLRHKLFRKIKRRNKAEAELRSKIAEKELKRRLRKPKFDDGSDDELYWSVAPQYRSDNTVAGAAGEILDADRSTNTATWKDAKTGRKRTIQLPEDYWIMSAVPDATFDTVVPDLLNLSRLSNSGVAKIHRRLYLLSNNKLQDPILGAYARFSDSWNNNTNPIKAIWDQPATKAALMEYAYAKTLQLAGKLSKLNIDYNKLGNMSLLELDEFFLSHPSLVTVDKSAQKFANRYQDLVENTIKPKYILAIQNAGKQYTKEMDAAISNTPEVLSADFGPYSKWGGYYTNDQNRIILNSNYNLSDSQAFGRIAHEKHHAYRNSLGQLNKFYPNLDIQMGSESIADIARSGYTPEEMNALEAYLFTPDKLVFNSKLKPLAEKGATNSEIVARMSYDLGVSGEDLNLAIRTMPKSSLIKYLGTNAYGRNFLKTPMTKEREKAIRNALLKVASVTPIGIAAKDNFDEGKDGISDDLYYRIMEDVANQNYKDWGFDNPDDALVAALNDNGYDYRGYYNKYPHGSGNAKDHWSDEFKTAYHPTFSEESKYSGLVSDYNPKGIRGGTWSKLRPVYRLSKDQIANGWNIDKTKQYLAQEGVLVKTPYDPYMLLERTFKDGSKRYYDEDGQLLNPTTLGLLGGNASYSMPDMTPLLDWKWQDTTKPELNANQRLALYMQNNPARDIDKVILGMMAAGVAPVAALASGVAALASHLAPGSTFWTDPITKSMFYGTVGALGADVAAKAATGKTFEEFGEQYLGLPWYLSGFVNPGGYLSPVDQLRIPGQKALSYILNRALLAYDKFPYRLKIPKTLDSFYRRLSNLSDDLAINGILDANQTGLIRANPKGTMTATGKREHFVGPYFEKGRIYGNLDDGDVVIQSVRKNKTADVEWMPVDPHQKELIASKNSNLYIPITDGYPGVAPAEDFIYWTRGDGVISKHLWKKSEFYPKYRLSDGSLYNWGYLLAAINKNLPLSQLYRDMHFARAAHLYAKGSLIKEPSGKPLLQYHTIGDEHPTGWTSFDPNIEGSNSAIYTTSNGDMSSSYSGAPVSEEERGFMAFQHVISNMNYLKNHEIPTIKSSIEHAKRIGDNSVVASLKKLLNWAEKNLRKPMSFYETKPLDPKRRLELYGAIDRPWIIEGNGAPWNLIMTEAYGEIGDPLVERSTREIESMLGEGFKYKNGAIIKDILDYGGRKIPRFGMTPGDVFIYKDPRFLKLADAVIYDLRYPYGIRPLTARDNFTINDITYNVGKDIHIKPSKRGTFTAAAKKHGMSVLAYARKVLKAPKGKYSSAMREKANFARNAAKFKH